MRHLITSRIPLLSILVSSVLIQTSANADFFGRLPATLGGSDWQAYYDDELDITWTANASFLGFTDWASAVAAAAALSINDVTGWRLPNMDVDSNGTLVVCNAPGTSAAECLDNEFGYQYWVNGVTAADPQLPFNNIVASGYWSSTTAGDFAWGISMDSGNHGAGGIGTESSWVWAVHDGDVLVPEPSTLLLMGSGLIGMAAYRRRTR